MAERAIVLNIDDDPSQRYATSRILRHGGFEVVEAATGSEGLEKAEQAPHLVVLDLRLPDLDGFEVCRRLRERSTTARTPEARRLAFLAYAGEVLGSSVDLGLTLANVAKVAVPLLADSCAIDLLRVHRGAVAADPGNGRSMIVPLLARDRAVGSLTLTLEACGRTFDREDLDLGRELGRRAGQAIANAQRYAEAQSALSHKNEILEVVSHDLRDPLSVVRIGTDLLLRNANRTPGPTARNLTRVADAARRMTELVQTLLDTTAISSGRLNLDKRSVSMESVLRELHDTFRPSADAKRSRLSWSTSVGAVVCDPPRLQQSMSNLVANALKFTPVGGKVTISTIREEKRVGLVVSDTGPGIPPDAARRIFDRYFQVEKSRGQGLGLGLYIARGIAEAHGGSLAVESVVGQGATFTLWLPASG